MLNRNLFSRLIQLIELTEQNVQNMFVTVNDTCTLIGLCIFSMAKLQKQLTTDTKCTQNEKHQFHR